VYITANQPDTKSNPNQIKSNHLFWATRPTEKKQKRQKQTETQKRTQNHKQTEGQTDEIKQTSSTNYKLTTSTTLLLLLLKSYTKYTQH